MNTITYIIDIDEDGYFQVDECKDGKRVCLFTSKEKKEDIVANKVTWKTIKEKLENFHDIIGKKRISVHGTSSLVMEAMTDLQDSIDKFGYATVEELSFYFGEVDDEKVYGRTHGWTNLDDTLIYQEDEFSDELLVVMPPVAVLEDRSNKKEN